MAAKRTTGKRKYSKKASDKVGEALHEMKAGKLTSGRSNVKVKSRKQAIAIGLSEARAEGAKAPAKKGARKAAKRGAAKKGTRGKPAGKRARKAPAKKRARKG